MIIKGLDYIEVWNPDDNEYYLTYLDEYISLAPDQEQLQIIFNVCYPGCFEYINERVSRHYNHRRFDVILDKSGKCVVTRKPVTS